MGNWAKKLVGYGKNGQKIVGYGRMGPKFSGIWDFGTPYTPPSPFPEDFCHMCFAILAAAPTQLTH